MPIGYSPAEIGEPVAVERRASRGVLLFTKWLTIHSGRSRIRSAAGSSNVWPPARRRVGEVTGDFGVSKPAISKHLKVLEEAGVVTRVIEGRTHRLSLEPKALDEAADWMDRQRALWERMFDVVDEYLKEEPK